MTIPFEEGFILTVAVAVCIQEMITISTIQILSPGL
jgi:hypothetical protein